MNLYTVYLAILSLPVLTPIIFWLSAALKIPTLAFGGPDFLYTWLLLGVGYIIVSIGSWGFSEAFRRAKNSPPIAATDVLILPLGALYDYLRGKLDFNHPHALYLGASFALIAVGAFWCVWRFTPASSQKPKEEKKT